MKTYTRKDSNFYFGGKPAVDWFNRQITERREQHEYEEWRISPESREIAFELKENGFVYLPQALDKQLLEVIRDSANRIINEGEKLKINNEHFAFISQPLMHVDGLNELVFSDKFVEIAEAYFECKPAVGTLSLRRSKINNLPPRDTQFV